MDLIVGVNSYMTLAEANSIVENMYLSNDTQRVYWNKLGNSDKGTLIYRTTKKIDTFNMNYKGSKATAEQPMQFPRKLNNDASSIFECPENIKIAIILQMFNDFDSENNDEIKLRDMGVKSFSDGGGASISFSDIPKDKVKINNVNKNIFDTYIKPYTIMV